MVLRIRTTGMRLSAGAVDGCDAMISYAELALALPTTDCLVFACSLTEMTHHLVDASAPLQLPKGARVVNVARGDKIDEPALIDALTTGPIGGAHLDVFAQEPLPADSPLWSMKNALLARHELVRACRDPSTSAKHGRRHVTALAALRMSAVPSRAVGRAAPRLGSR